MIQKKTITILCFQLWLIQFILFAINTFISSTINSVVPLIPYSLLVGPLIIFISVYKKFARITKITLLFISIISGIAFILNTLFFPNMTIYVPFYLINTIIPLTALLLNFHRNKILRAFKGTNINIKEQLLPLASILFIAQFFVNIYWFSLFVTVKLLLIMWHFKLPKKNILFLIIGILILTPINYFFLNLPIMRTLVFVLILLIIGLIILSLEDLQRKSPKETKKKVVEKKPKPKISSKKTITTQSTTPHDLKTILPWLFLIAITVLIITNIFPNAIIEANKSLVYASITILGLFAFWLNRDVIEDIKEENYQEKEKEKKREKKFDKKFVSLSKFNFTYNIKENYERKDYLQFATSLILAPFIFLMRVPYSFSKAMFKEGWWFASILLVLIFIGFYIRIFNLGDLSLWWDEIFSGKTVLRILETGTPLEPSGITHYWRGVAYHYVLALSTMVFGVTEFALRLPGVLFSTGILVFSYFLSKNISKKVAIFVLAILVFSTYSIEYARFARFYIMLAALILVGIYFTYKGFYKNNSTYKYLSVLSYFLMVTTVQLGAIFIGIVATFLAIHFFEKEYYNISNLFNNIKNEIENIILVLIAVIIAVIRNPFEFFAEKLEFAGETSVNIIDLTLPFPSMPEFHTILFFHNSYLNTIIILPLFLILVYMIWRKIENDERINLFDFSLLSFVGMMIVYELVNRGIFGARIHFMFEIIFVILIIYTLYLLFRILTRNNTNAINLLLIIFVLAFTFSSQPNFYERVTIDYGQSTLEDPFRTTPVAAYRADHKTTYEFLEENIQEGDLWMATMLPSYFYYNNSPDYIINQNTNWDRDLIKNEQDVLIDPIYGSIVLHRALFVKNEIENTNNTIWIVVNGASVNIHKGNHLRKDFLQYVKLNEEKIVFKSEDGDSFVMKFEK